VRVDAVDHLTMSELWSARVVEQSPEEGEGVPVRTEDCESTAST
jgi:hypothetical protein